MKLTESTRPASIVDQPHVDYDSDWWYVRAYPGRSELMDAACDVVIPWLGDVAEEVDGGRWFFLRYIDMVGPHLRLRVRCSLDDVDRLNTRIPELQHILENLTRPSESQPLLPNALFGDSSGAVLVSPSLYAPETHKYGGPHGVAAAERLFTAAAQWYSHHHPDRLPRRFERAALAVTLMRDLVSAALPREHRREFWAHHRRQWGWQLVMTVQGQSHIPPLVAETAAGVQPALGEVDTSAVRSHVRTVVSTLDEVTEFNSELNRFDLLLNYLHMDINRWGFVPAEEALLGMVTTSLRARTES